ncbi:hypothetical protein [Arsenicicoccus bolidensis]|uniref:hypothetical protein n=1 Tax=Arsenicicoccus bolidensis TaxID=229480 RepID=UPI0028B220DC|nr:hypothetical protein [Arsenicicoccus bolidensis]
MNDLNVLVLEDKGPRAQAIGRTLRELASEGNADAARVFAYPVSTPAEMKRSLDEDPDFYHGAIVDFSLGLKRDDVSEDIFLAHLPGGYGPYRVTTGIGVLDYLHANYPAMRLWAMTSGDARHLRLYQAAASAMFGAFPVDFDDVRVQDPARNQAFLEVLINPLGTTPDQTIEDAEAFRSLLTEQAGIAPGGQFIGAFSWMAALVNTVRGAGKGASHTWFRKVYTAAATYQGVTPVPGATLQDKSLYGAHWKWNRHLQELLKYSPAGDDLVPAWPPADFDAEYAADAGRTSYLFNQFDPYAEYIRTVAEVEEFFISEDVHAAVRRWLATESK